MGEKIRLPPNLELSWGCRQSRTSRVEQDHGQGSRESRRTNQVHRVPRSQARFLDSNLPKPQTVRLAALPLEKQKVGPFRPKGFPRPRQAPDT